jgi:hypothetical protein
METGTLNVKPRNVSQGKAELRGEVSWSGRAPEQ